MTVFIRGASFGLVMTMTQLAGLKRELRQRGMTFETWIVLGIAQENPGIPFNEMAELSGVVPGALTSKTALLERKGLIRIVRGQKDRRKYSAEVTEEGLRMLKEVTL